MKSHTTQRFRAALKRLPASVRQQARDAYRLFIANPNHPGLQFKQVHTRQPTYSARVSQSYRALGQLDGNDMVWFWIGTHADYVKILKQLR